MSGMLLADARIATPKDGQTAPKFGDLLRAEFLRLLTVESEYHRAARTVLR